MPLSVMSAFVSVCADLSRVVMNKVALTILTEVTMDNSEISYSDIIDPSQSYMCAGCPTDIFIDCMPL